MTDHVQPYVMDMAPPFVVSGRPGWELGQKQHRPSSPPLAIAQQALMSSSTSPVRARKKPATAYMVVSLQQLLGIACFALQDKRR